MCFSWPCAPSSWLPWCVEQSEQVGFLEFSRLDEGRHSILHCGKHALTSQTVCHHRDAQSVSEPSSRSSDISDTLSASKQAWSSLWLCLQWALTETCEHRYITPPPPPLPPSQISTYRLLLAHTNLFPTQSVMETDPSCASKLQIFTFPCA